MKAAKYFNSTLPCPKHLNNSRCCWCGHKPPDVEVKSSQGPFRDCKPTEPACQDIKDTEYWYPNNTLSCPRQFNNARCCWCGWPAPPRDVEVKPKYDFDPRKFFVCLFVRAQEGQPCQQHQLLLSFY